MGAQYVNHGFDFTFVGVDDGQVFESDAVLITPQNPCQISVSVEPLVTINGGYVDGTGKIQFVLDAHSTTWWDHPFLVNMNAATGGVGNFDKPIYALRFQCTSNAMQQFKGRLQVVQMI